MKLYAYWRSSTSYRARIALNLKGLKPELVPINLLKGEQKQESYASLNPEMRVPTLIDEGHTLTQSLAIIEYLEEKYPNPPLLPTAPHERARVRALALAVACDMSPLNNLGPLNFLTQQLRLSDAQRNEWMQHWFHHGFAALERMLQNPATGSYCHGSAPTMADCCLVPQVYNGYRFNCDMSAYPTVVRIADRAARHPAFIAAHPSQQPDAA